jgi:hypothetical protein
MFCERLFKYDAKSSKNQMWPILKTSPTITKISIWRKKIALNFKISLKYCELLTFWRNMKETPSFANPLETSVVRIQYWLGKDKEILLHSAPALSKAQEFCKKYKCNLVKPPRIVSQVDRLQPHGDDFINKKRQITQDRHSKPLGITVNQSHCNINQKDLHYFQLEKTLSSARVAQCRHKEHYLVAKRLKDLSQQADSGPKSRQIVQIKSSTEEELSKNPYLEDWGKFKEERQFQISRF